MMDESVAYLTNQGRYTVFTHNNKRYNADGEKQITEYLDYWNLNTGYMLSFNFYRNKEPGVKRIQLGDKVLFEGTV